MLTEKGLEIIGKYLLGHTQSYANYLAIGCGSTNPNVVENLTLQPTQRELVAHGTDPLKSTATLTFSSHYFQVGDSILVEGLGDYFDGTQTVASITSTTITYHVNYPFPSVASVDYAAPSATFATVTTNVDHHFRVGDVLTFSSITYLTTSGGYDIRQVIDARNFTVYDTSTTETGTEVGTIDLSSNYVNYGSVTRNSSVSQKSLKFEMERFPVSVRGIKDINNVTSLVFGAELPTQERYGITEIGLFSSVSNPITFDSADSKMLCLFTDAENWQIHNTDGSSVDVLAFPESLSVGTNSDLSTNLIGTTTNTTLYPDFTNYPSNSSVFIQSSNSMFAAEGRVAALEQPRMYDSTLVVSGGLTASGPTGIDQANVAVIPASTARHVHLKTNTSLFDFSKNSTTDEIKVAFSLLKANAAAGGTADPTTFSMKIVFSNEDAAGAKSAMISINGSMLGSYSKRYYVIKKKLSELTTDSGFSWGNVNTVKVFLYIDGSANYMVALDGIRFENVFDETLNPYYGLVAYSEVAANTTPINSVTQYITPISKIANSKNMIEYAIPIDLYGSKNTA